MKVHNPPNDRELDELYVFMSVDDNGMRGIVASLVPALGASGPLVTGSLGVAEYFKGLAEQVARRTGKRIVMYRFRRGEELWSTDPTQ
jgi:hypothetical protein